MKGSMTGVLRMEPKPKKCEACGGDGVLLMYHTDRAHIEVEKCDECNRFETDRQAWQFVRPLRKAGKGMRVGQQMKLYGSIEECPHCGSGFVIQHDDDSLSCGTCRKAIGK